MFHSDVFFDAAYRTHDWNVDLLQSFADHHFKLSLIMMSVKVGQVCMYHVSKDATVITRIYKDSHTTTHSTTSAGCSSESTVPF